MSKKIKVQPDSYKSYVFTDGKFLKTDKRRDGNTTREVDAVVQMAFNSERAVVVNSNISSTENTIKRIVDRFSEHKSILTPAICSLWRMRGLSFAHWEHYKSNGTNHRLIIDCYKNPNKSTLGFTFIRCGEVEKRLHPFNDEDYVLIVYLQSYEDYLYKALNGSASLGPDSELYHKWLHETYEL